MQHPPAPADPGAASRLLDRFAALGDAEAAFAAGPGAALLAGLGGGSPFLADLALREHAALLAMATDGEEQAVGRAIAQLRAVPPDASRAQIMAITRQAKRQVALLTAVADLRGAWGLVRVTAAITSVAEAAVGLTVSHLLLAAHRAHEITLPDPSDPERGSGFIVLGMGKLGAGELNYSSDIDLILLFDPDVHVAGHPDRADTLGATFTRIARNLVAMMEVRDADGYVFRTDLRLRPDPAATPPCVSLPAAITYYESVGQNWERAAMIKARPIGGDREAGWRFLEAIRPFVWRRGLDFAAIADISGMKARIDVHRGTQNGLPGLDVKLGQGGIREVEFTVQTLQLVWGGRDPALRDRTTLGALRHLVRAGRIGRRAAAELSVAYRALRQVEHRLQMVADRQTHSLPEKPEQLDPFAVFMGFDGWDRFAAWLQAHRDRVRHRYAEVFGAVPVRSDTALDLSGADVPPQTVRRLEAMGFRSASGIVQTLRGWQAGRVRALRSSRARELMDGVLPALLPALARQADPDAAFARFDMLLSRLPAGVGLLSMLSRNPALLDRVAGVLGAAPSLANHLAQVPTALEGLLDPNAGDMDPAGTLRRRLTDARTLDDAVAITRSLVRAEEFRLCVAQMEGWIDVDAAGFARTALADAALQALLRALMTDRPGMPRGGDVAVVALGKAGGREMMAGSDLDLMLIYSHPAQVAGGQWFIRLAHAFVAALTAQGAEGPLYAVDMRLRPSGNKGPVAVSLASFQQYHAKDAWTWERMALVRARVVAGGPAIRARVQRAIAAALRTGGDPRPDAAAMRGRLLRELPASGPWDVKLRPGGGIEVEFVAQTLQLLHGTVPGGQTTRIALQALGDAGLLPEAAALIEADRLWRTIQSMTRITAGPGARDLPPPAEAALLRAAASGVDLPALRDTMANTAAMVRDAFIRHVGIPE